MNMLAIEAKPFDENVESEKIDCSHRPCSRPVYPRQSNPRRSKPERCTRAYYGLDDFCAARHAQASEASLIFFPEQKDFQRQEEIDIKKKKQPKDRTGMRKLRGFGLQPRRSNPRSRNLFCCCCCCFNMETIQAEASLQGIQVNHKLLPK